MENGALGDDGECAYGYRYFVLYDDLSTWFLSEISWRGTDRQAAPTPQIILCARYIVEMHTKCTRTHYSTM